VSAAFEHGGARASTLAPARATSGRISAVMPPFDLDVDRARTG